MVSEVLAGYVQIFRPCAGKPQLTAFFPPPSGGTTFPVESSSDMSDAQRFIFQSICYHLNESNEHLICNEGRVGRVLCSGFLGS